MQPAPEEQAAQEAVIQKNWPNRAARPASVSRVPVMVENSGRDPVLLRLVDDALVRRHQRVDVVHGRSSTRPVGCRTTK